MALNHNIINKISEEYIEEKIREEEDKIYAYTLYWMNSMCLEESVFPQRDPYPTMIKAVKGELNIKIFNNEIDTLLSGFMLDNRNDKCIMACLDPSLKKNLDRNLDGDIVKIYHFYRVAEAIIYDNWRKKSSKHKEYIYQKIDEFMDNLIIGNSKSCGYYLFITNLNCTNFNCNFKSI